MIPAFRPLAASRGPQFGSRGGASGQGSTTTKNFMNFFRQIRNRQVLSVLVAFSTRVFNILRGEPQSDVIAPHVSMWPSSVQK